MADFGTALLSALAWAGLFALCIALAHWLKAPGALLGRSRRYLTVVSGRRRSLLG
ncbi:MAG TPA: hypothetical protein VFZ14_11995 [Burkholderiales bacterium]|nr:hypothetical protein [Burkholderiales bacterium]